MKASKFVVAAVIGASCLMAASAQAALVAVDYFNGTAGVSLDGHVTDVGGKNWVVDGGAPAVFNGTSGVTTSSGYGAAQAAMYMGGSQPWDYSIVANVMVSSNVKYVALAFANRNWGLDFNGLGQPSVRLFSNGSYQFYGVSGQSASGVFDPTVFNKFELRYIVGNPGVKLYVNDAEVADQWVGGLVSTSAAAQYTSAAFRIDNGAGSGGAVIDYLAVGSSRPFEVPADPSAVPEPATLGMLGLVGAGLMIKRRS